MITHGLLEETITKLAEHGRTPADVRWVGNQEGTRAIDWETFTHMADRSYHWGSTHLVVADDLVLVGDDWWLERWEYESSYGWDYKTQPRRQPDARGFATPFLHDEYERPNTLAEHND